VSVGPLIRNIDLSHLLTLKRVAETGSFSAAAAELGYVQSAVSSQVAALEAAAGHRLLERTRGTRRTTATEAGRIILQHADEIFAALRALETDLAALGGMRPLRIAATAAAARGVLPGLLRQLAARSLSVEVLDTPRGAGAQGLVADGLADIAFTSGPVHEWLEALEITRDPFRLVVGNGKQARASLSSLAAETLYTLPATSAQDELEEVLRTHGFRPRRVSRLADPSLVGTLATAGAGVALLPRLAFDAPPENVVPLDTLHPGQPLYAVWARSASADVHARVAGLARDALAA